MDHDTQECLNPDRRMTGPIAAVNTSASNKMIAECLSVGHHNTCQNRRARFHPRNGVSGYVCPIDQWAKAMTDADVGERESELIFNDRVGVAHLKALKSLSVARCLVRSVPTEIAADSYGTPRQLLTGRERFIALGGSRGMGKTLAASYVIAYLGGKYTTAQRFARPGLDLDVLMRVPGALVIDQLGREYSEGWAQAQIEDVVDERYRRKRLTILVGNLTRELFVKRYGTILDDRIEGDGAFVVLYGDSLRREPK